MSHNIMIRFRLDTQLYFNYLVFVSDRNQTVEIQGKIGARLIIDYAEKR